MQRLRALSKHDSSPDSLDKALFELLHWNCEFQRISQPHQEHRFRGLQLALVLQLYLPIPCRLDSPVGDSSW